MRRVLAGLLFFLAGVLIVLGGITAAQLRSPLWQKSVAFLLVSAVAYAIFWAGQRVGRRT